MKKKIIAFAITCIIAVTSVFQVSAAGVVSDREVPISGTAEATTITVTVPTSMAFVIDPNADTPFVSAPAEVISATMAKLDIDLISIKPAEDSSAAYPEPTVVAPDSVADWAQLGVMDTQSKIALGLKSDQDATTIWSPGEADVSEESAGTVKTIGPQTTGTVQLDCKHGMSWSKKYTMNYTLILRIALAEA